MSENEPFSRACKAVGGQNAMARKLSTPEAPVPQATIWSWLNRTKRGVPAEWCRRVEEVSGVPIHELRPDVYRKPPDEASTEMAAA